jgi:DNA-binding beta-propeller fold protein YncE
MKISKNMKFLTCSVAILTLAISPCFAQENLLALSKGDHTLKIIDPSSLKIIASIPVGEDPHEVIASADGKTAYVSIYGGGRLHEMDIIDLIGHKALPAIDTKPFFGLHGLAFENNEVWFTAEGSKSVARYNPATAKFDWAMGTGQDRTHMLYVTTGAKYIYTTNVASATVSILADTLFPARNHGGNFTEPAHHDWVQTIIPVGKGSEGFDVSPDGQQLWTAGAEDGTITIIDLASKKVITTLAADVKGANRLKFTPNGKQVLITSLNTGDLFVFNVATRQLAKTISTGHGAAGILMDKKGQYAYIGCTADDYIAVLDLATLQIVHHIAVRGADGLAWAKR